jgi:hypothetical protein
MSPLRASRMSLTSRAGTPVSDPACWRGSVCNRAVARAQRRFWSAAGSEAPRRFGFKGRGTYAASGSTTVRERSKAPSPLGSAGAVQSVARAGDAMFATEPLLERAGVFGVRREAKRHAALDSGDEERMRPGFPQPSGNHPKRRRRCALPAHSKASHVLERQCLQQGRCSSARAFLDCCEKRSTTALWIQGTWNA